MAISYNSLVNAGRLILNRCGGPPNVSLPRKERGVFESGSRTRRENQAGLDCGAAQLEAVRPNLLIRDFSSTWAIYKNSI